MLDLGQGGKVGLLEPESALFLWIINIPLRSRRQLEACCDSWRRIRSRIICNKKKRDLPSYVVIRV